MHHYLQVEELWEQEEAEEIREAGELKVAKKTLSKSCIKDIHQQSKKTVDLDKMPPRHSALVNDRIVLC
jgi:hypothetical protein